MTGRRPVTARDMLYVVFINRTAIMTLFLATLLIAYVYCVLAPPVYRAETILLVRMGSSQVPLIDQYRPEAYHTTLFEERAQNIRSEMELFKGQYLTLKVLAALKGRIDPAMAGRPFARRLTDRTGAVTDTVLFWLGLAPAPAGQEVQRVLAFLDSLHVTSPDDADMISVAFDWTEPAFAAMAANLYADEFMAHHAFVHESAQSYRTYAEQATREERGLAGAEAGLKELAREDGGDTRDGATKRQLVLRAVADLKARRDQVALDYEKARAKVGRIREMAQNKEGWIETPDADGGAPDRQAALRALDDSYLGLKAERERLVRQPAPGQDEVRSIDERIGAVRKQKADALLQGALMELSLLTHRLSGLKRRIAAEERKLQELNARAVRLRQLEKDREVAEQNYLALRKKAEGLRTSGDGGTWASQVRIASPAMAPLMPAYPKKGRIMLISALCGLLLGLAFAAVKERVVRTFRMHEDVYDVLGVPLLLSVPESAASGSPHRAKRPVRRPMHRLTGGVLHGLRKIRRRLRLRLVRQATPESFMTRVTRLSTFLVIALMLLTAGCLLYLYWTMVNQEIPSSAMTLSAEPDDRAASPVAALPQEGVKEEDRKGGAPRIFPKAPPAGISGRDQQRRPAEDVDSATGR